MDYNADHNEVERRRRQNYGRHFDNLFKVLGKTRQKTSKIELLNFAKQYIEDNTQIGNSNTSQIDLKFQSIIEKASNSFTIVFECFTGLILNVSENVINVINYRNDELIENLIFDYIDPQDLPSVKQQFSENLEIKQSNLLDPLTGLIKNRGPAVKAHNMKNHRAFITRLRNKESNATFFYIQFIGTIHQQENNECTYFLGTVKRCDTFFENEIHVPIITQSTSSNHESLPDIAGASHAFENITDYDDDTTIDKFPELFETH